MKELFPINFYSQPNLNTPPFQTIYLFFIIYHDQKPYQNQPLTQPLQPQNPITQTPPPNDRSRTQGKYLKKVWLLTQLHQTHPQIQIRRSYYPNGRRHEAFELLWRRNRHDHLHHGFESKLHPQRNREYWANRKVRDVGGDLRPTTRKLPKMEKEFS